jgi:uncharacterized protein YjgD (DUF1641 family)
MAIAVEFREFTPKNSRHDLIRRLEEAPEKHAEAILAAYELLERLYEKGLIDIANGLLSASDTLIARAADVASSKQAITALRLALICGSLIDSVDPDRVAAVLSPPRNKPHTLWIVIKQAVASYFRLVLVTAIELVKVVGHSVRKREPPRT